MIEQKEQALADAKLTTLALEDAMRADTPQAWEAVSMKAAVAKQSALVAHWREGAVMADKVRDQARRILRIGARHLN